MYCRYIRESKCTAKIRMIYGSATEDIISGSRGACLEAGLRGPRCHVTVFIRDLRGGITVLNQKGPLTAIAKSGDPLRPADGEWVIFHSCSKIRVV